MELLVFQRVHRFPIQSFSIAVDDFNNIALLTARDGLEGVELAHANQPDVILMDINLPGISGIEALKILREDPVTAHIPVVNRVQAGR
jgi:CheY-like chemotaxis protein